MYLPLVGNEFKNQAIDDILETFNIEHSLKHEGMYKVIKTEFVKNQRFETLEELGYELVDYEHWYNNHRLHSSLGYLSPVAYRQNTLEKVV